MKYLRVKDPTEMVVFFKTDLREGADEEAYGATSRRMHEIVEAMPGFIGMKTYSSEDGDEVFIARFKDEASLEAWRLEPEHLEVQRRGREEFYRHFWVQVCKVTRQYEFWAEGK